MLRDAGGAEREEGPGRSNFHEGVCPSPSATPAHRRDQHDIGGSVGLQLETSLTGKLVRRVPCRSLEAGTHYLGALIKRQVPRLKQVQVSSGQVFVAR